ncbi:MAG: D-alanine--D-alanine ligase, partial [Pseudomonadota bacterium]
ALGVTELIIEHGFYDYEHKYTEGRTQHVCPAKIPPEIAALCEEYALKAHTVLGCHGTSRTDYRWDDELGEEGLFALETNTQPGMTPLSLVPEQARRAGIDYSELVDLLVKDALRRGSPARVQERAHG